MLLEREKQLGELRNCLAQARAGQGGVVLIGGEAGVGKTSLLQEFRARNPEQVIHWGMCDALFTPQALGPIYEIALGMSAPLQSLATQSATSIELFPAILAELSGDDCRLIIIEDVHWADYATLDFIKFIGRRISILNTVLVISYRSDEIDMTHPAQSVFGDLQPRLTTRITLQALSLESIELLNRDSTYKSEQLLNITGGNPFFLTEVLASAAPHENSVPASIKEAVNARLNRLDEEERRFLEFASLVPGLIHPELLKQRIGNADTLAMAAVGRNILKADQDGGLRFRHELARLATLARIPAGQRRDYHADFLKILLAEGASIPKAQIVHHASGADNVSAVLEYAPKAADEAAITGAHREAAAHLGTALQFVDHAEAEDAALLYERWAYEAGLALSIDDEVIEARRHAMTLWRALGRMDKVGENMRWLSRLLWYRGESAQANRYADEAVRILENEAPSEERAKAYSLRSQMHMLNGRMDEAVHWGKKALATSSAAEVSIHALNNIGTAKIFRGNTSGLKDMEQSLSLAKQYGLHEDAARVYTNLAEYAVEFRDFTLAERIINEGIAYDTQHDLDAWTFYLVGRFAQLRLEQGRLHDAITIAEGVLLRNDQTLLMRLPALVVHAKAKMRLGAAESHSLLQTALESALSVDELQYIAPIRAALIEQAWYDQRPDGAAEHFEGIKPSVAEHLIPWVGAELYFWASLCGFKVPNEAALQFPSPYQKYHNHQTLDAAHEFQQYNTPYIATAVLCSGEDAQALILGIELAQKMEAKHLSKKLQQRAKALNLDLPSLKTPRGPYGAARQHPLGLTKKEQQVLALIATGASNHEIAQQLSRSKRTVEHHVSAIFNKMNVESRVDVLLRLHNEPWLVNS